MDPSISILLPTRGRTDQLARSVLSLSNLAADWDRVQVLYGVDADDEPTWGLACNLARTQDWVWATPRRGYDRLYEYTNALVDQARGDWIMFWNDDATMQTEHWDAVIHQYDDQDLILWLQTTSLAEMLLFPVVPRRFIEQVGHFSLSPHNDTWWSDIGGWLGINRLISVLADHHVASSYHDPAFYSTEQHALRWTDAEIIGRLIRREARP